MSGDGSAERRENTAFMLKGKKLYLSFCLQRRGEGKLLECSPSCATSLEPGEAKVQMQLEIIRCSAARKPGRVSPKLMPTLRSLVHIPGTQG